MGRYRKKPIVIDAVQYAGHGSVHGSANDIPEWFFEAFEDGTLVPTNGADPLRVTTMEGDIVVSPGDWVIRGVKGELYPCKPDIFEETYEAV